MTGNRPGDPWWIRLRRALRGGAELVAEIVGRPRPEPVLYLRCGACGRVAPRTIVRHHGWLERGGAQAMPPEHLCPLCGTYAPRMLGDQVDPDNPDVATVTITCATRFGCLQFWRRCATNVTAPAEASLVDCPACGRRYPGRVGDQDV